MTQATTTPSTLTIGIDLGNRMSHVCFHGRHEETALKIAAPELDGPQQAPSRASELIQECAWKHGD